MGSTAIEGAGQHIGRVDARTFFRWQQEHPGCWSEDGFVKEFLKNNPCYRAAGYRI